MTAPDDLAGRLDAIISGQGAKPSPTTTRTGARQFSSYVDEDVDRATALASSFMVLADAKGGVDGLRDAVEEAERALGREMPGLVPYAVKLFLTHHEGAQRILRPDQPDQP